MAVSRACACASVRPGLSRPIPDFKTRLPRIGGGKGSALNPPAPNTSTSPETVGPGWRNPRGRTPIIVKESVSSRMVRPTTFGSAPQSIADHGHGSETEREVLRTKQPSNLRGHTQHGKVAETAVDRLETLGLFRAGQILATLEDRGHIFKYSRSRLQVIQFGLGKLNVPQSYAGLVKEDSYQTIRLAEGKRTQQHGIHDAEDRRIGPDSQGQRQDGHDGECGLLAQHAQTVTHILKQSPHIVGRLLSRPVSAAAETCGDLGSRCKFQTRRSKRLCA